jgi:hypothetical protein
MTRPTDTEAVELPAGMRLVALKSSDWKDRFSISLALTLARAGASHRAVDAAGGRGRVRSGAEWLAGVSVREAPPDFPEGRPVDAGTAAPAAEPDSDASFEQDRWLRAAELLKVEPIAPDLAEATLVLIDAASELLRQSEADMPPLRTAMQLVRSVLGTLALMQDDIETQLLVRSFENLRALLEESRSIASRQREGFADVEPVMLAVILTTAAADTALEVAKRAAVATPEQRMKLFGDRDRRFRRFRSSALRSSRESRRDL